MLYVQIFIRFVSCDTSSSANSSSRSKNVRKSFTKRVKRREIYLLKGCDSLLDVDAENSYIADEME